MDLSVILVNYNVKEFLSNCLESVYRAAEGLSFEIIVVDNASADGSKEFLEPKFPGVHFIWNSQNVGFGAANNQAIRQAKGRYILLLNPDTLLQEDSLQVMIRYMEEHPECGASGCKILNADGSFAPESRRSVPTLMSSLYKTLGLTAIFPQSHRFGRYYLGWLPEDEGGKVPVLSGSFMFFRGEVLRELKGFDERFFMYGEDIDLCVRVTEAGWNIDYVPDTSIIHYKGESSRKEDLRYIRHFNEAMYLFYEKHYSQGVYRLFRVVIRLAVFVRTLVSFLSQRIKRLAPYVSDLVWMNLSLFGGLAIRWGFSLEKLSQIDYSQFLWLNGLMTAIVLMLTQIGGGEEDKRLQLSSAMKRVVVAFTGLIIITFFARELAFSRVIILVAFALSLVMIPLSRMVFSRRNGILTSSSGSWSRPRMLLVGVGPQTAQIMEKMETSADLRGEIFGLIHQSDWDQQGSGETIPGGKQPFPVPVIGSVSQLPGLVNSMNITHVIVIMEAVSNREILQLVAQLQSSSVQIALIPRDMDLLLGKEVLEYLGDLPLMDVPAGFLQPNRKATKRSFDLLFSTLLMTITVVPAIFSTLWSKASGKKKSIIHFFDGEQMDSMDLFEPIDKFHYGNLWKLLSHVWIGKMSLVGSDLSRVRLPGNSDDVEGVKPVMTTGDHHVENQFPWLQTGLSSYASLTPSRIRSKEDLDRFDQAYARQYSFWLDLEIMLRSLKKGPFQLWKVTQTESKKLIGT